MIEFLPYHLFRLRLGTNITLWQIPMKLFWGQSSTPFSTWKRLFFQFHRENSQWGPDNFFLSKSFTIIYHKYFKMNKKINYRLHWTLLVTIWVDYFGCKSRIRNLSLNWWLDLHVMQYTENLRKIKWGHTYLEWILRKYWKYVFIFVARVHIFFFIFKKT